MRRRISFFIRFDKFDGIWSLCSRIIIISNILKLISILKNRTCMFIEFNSTILHFFVQCVELIASKTCAKSCSTNLNLICLTEQIYLFFFFSTFRLIDIFEFSMFLYNIFGKRNFFFSWFTVQKCCFLPLNMTHEIEIYNSILSYFNINANIRNAIQSNQVRSWCSAGCELLCWTSNDIIDMREIWKMT